MIFISPTLAFTSVMQTETSMDEMKCCMMNDSVEDEEKDDCCLMSTAENDSNSCEDNNCTPNSCHFTQTSVFHVFIPKNNLIDNLNLDFSEKSKFEFYQSLIIKDLADSTWKPPKYIS